MDQIQKVNELNALLPPIRCYYCGRFISNLNLKNETDLKLCCKSFFVSKAE